MNDILEILKYIEDQKGSSFFYTPLKTGDEFSYIFKSPEFIIDCFSKNDIDKTLLKIDELKEKYPYAYGFITYEVGYSFEERLSHLLKDINDKLISFSFFNSDAVEKIKTKNINFNSIFEILKQDISPIKKFQLNTDYKEYLQNIGIIKDLIKKGDTYQVNYTLKSHFDFDGDIKTLFARLLFNQSASYTAIINDENKYIISISPELFLKTEDNKITSKPMKGTTKRGLNRLEDDRERVNLANSSKDKAENIMIVDLLRNDLGKISKTNSVVAGPIYEIEKYETVYQMTSTVKAELVNNSFNSIIRNIFPCGSITGAPKIRTMEIINKLEKESRGVYTGTIGIMENNNFIFNIPIRTVSIDSKQKKGELGIGSGIVWDSDPSLEYNEVQLKGKFITGSQKYFELIETMLYENGNIFLFDYHLKRLKETAEHFLFYYDEKMILDSISIALKNMDVNKLYRLKLLLSKWGNINIDTIEIIRGHRLNKVLLSNTRTDSKNKSQYFKTTDREVYNKDYNSSKNIFIDLIYLNEKENISEGAISNILIMKNGKYYTPPIEDGILNGCYREYLLNTRKDIEVKSIGLDELLAAEKLILINSVRKEMEINELYQDGKVIKKYS